MEFEPRVALDYARKFSRPRMVGTREAQRVAEEIASQLARAGYEVQRQGFRFSTAFERILGGEILTGLVLVAATMLTLGYSRWLTLMLVVLLVTLIWLINPVNRWVQNNSVHLVDESPHGSWQQFLWKLGKRYRTENLAAAWPGASPGIDAPHLCLVAHYDSKSQYLPLALRIALFVILIAGGLAFALLALASLVSESFTAYALAVGVLVVISGLPLLLLDAGNRSPGAIDNASGLGLVLHLAEWIASQPELLGKLKFTILITSAEELGVKGAQACLQGISGGLDGRDELQVFNFDGIGVAGRLYLVGSARRRGSNKVNQLFHLVMESGSELGIPIGRFALPGALFDHAPFAEAGYAAISLVGIGKGSLAVHTVHDTPDKLHIRGFEQAGQLAIRVIEKMGRQ